MNLRTAADIVLGRIAGARKTSDLKISERRAMIELLIARDLFVLNELKNSPDLWKFTPEMFVIYGGSVNPVEDSDESTWIVPTWNDFLNRYHITLGSSPLNLRDDRGIDMIYPVGHPEQALIRVSSDMETQMYAVSQGMEGNLTWKITTFSDNKVVEFPNMTASTVIPRLVVKMIPASQAAMFKTVGMGDKISLPDLHLPMIMDKVEAVLRGLDNKQDVAPDALDQKRA